MTGPVRDTAARVAMVRSGGSPVQVTPVPWETTCSYLDRLARRHHLNRTDLLRGLGISFITMPEETGPALGRTSPYTTWELYLNASAQQIIADFCGLPQEYLRANLAEWAQRPGRSVTGAARARLYKVRKPSVTGCPKCALVRTGAPHPVQQYLPQTALVCLQHQVQMLGPHTLHGKPFPVEHADLSQAPEVLVAHRDHLRLIRRWGADGHRVVSVAMKVTESWRRAELPAERIWPARARRIGRGYSAQLWLALAREAVTYPEAIALARILLDHTFHDLRRRPRSWGQPLPIYAIVAGQLERPWLATPDLYPLHFSSQVQRLPHRHRSRDTSWWPYRWNPSDYGPIELTQLGYQPPGSPAPRRSAPRPTSRGTSRR